ncbi:MAG: MBL fold metallo-hydrolase [Acidobacteria bacterium]|nr:MAG: MBL fold metallo-hydrolase [Acidobacteriota bacterium]
MTIVNVGYRSTNYWVISEGNSRLLVDLGWPGMAGALFANLERKGIPFNEVRYGFATHYHMDHAGAAQDLKSRGMRLIVTPEQVASIEPMTQWMKPEFNYTPIVMADNLVVALSESRRLLKSIGFDGELVHTPGHSDDSVSLILDSGEAFTGDLTPPALATEEQRDAIESSWQSLRDRGASLVYAGHGPVRPLKDPRQRIATQ